MASLHKLDRLSSLARPQLHSSTRILLMRIHSPTSQLLRRRFHNKASKLQRFIPYQEPRRSEPKINPNFAVGAVIAACAGVWGYQYVYTRELLQTGSQKARRAIDQFNQNMVCSLNNIKAGRHYTLLTSTFTHIAPWHLAFNMLALWGFGTSVTMTFGVPTFAILWVGAGLTGGLVQTYAWMQEGGNKDQRSVGSSGAIMGIIGALTTVMPRSPVTFIVVPTSMITLTALTVGFSLACIKGNWLPQIAHWDHLGGMAFGLLYGLVVMRKGRFRGFPR